MIAAEISRPTIGSAAGTPSATADTGHHGQAGEPVDPRVMAVGFECRRSDPPAGADAVDRDPFVAEEPDQAGDRGRQQIAGRLRMDQAIDRLPGSDQRRDEDDRHHRDPREVLDPTQAVGQPARRRAPAQDEGGGERNGGQRVAGVVERATGVGLELLAAPTRERRLPHSPLPTRAAPAGVTWASMGSPNSARIAMPRFLRFVRARPARADATGGSHADGGSCRACQSRLMSSIATVRASISGSSSPSTTSTP
jgi:hypothetical protein